jgi:hypothetical protein
MTASDLSDLRERAENGDQEAVDELIELAGERGDWRWRYEIQWHPAPLGRDREPARVAFVRDHSNRSPAKMADRVLAMNRGSTGQR